MKIREALPPSLFGPRLGREWAAPLLAGLLFFACAWGAIWLTRNTGRVAAVWPANALLLAIILRKPPALTARFLVSAFFANIAADLLSGDTVIQSLSLAFANSAEIGLALRLFGAGYRKFPQNRLAAGPVIRFVTGCALVAPALSATIAATALAWTQGASFTQVWLNWGAADAMGMLVFAPPFLALPRQLIPAKKRQLIREGIPILALVAAASAWIFIFDGFPRVFPVYFLVLLAAFRLGLAGAGGALALSSLIGVIGTAFGQGPIAADMDFLVNGDLVLLQAYMVICVFTILPVAALLEDKSEALRLIRAQELRYRQLYNQTPALLVSVDGRARITHVSDYWLNHMGYRREDVIGRHVLRLVPHEDRAAAAACLKPLLSGPRQITDAPMRVMRKNGQAVDVLVSAIVQYDSDGNPAGVRGVCVDVTARNLADAALRASQAQLELAKERAEAANRAKSGFLANMSHELRTPLNAVIGFSQLLGMDNSLGQKQRDYCRHIQDSGEHLLELISDILDLTAIESNRLRIVIEPVAVADVLTHARDMTAALAEKHQVQAKVHLPEGLTVQADALRLRQVLTNLMSNAIKYNHAGGTVTVSAATTGDDHIRFTVADTGKGISQSGQAAIFQPFERLGAERSGIEGAGIGLAIVRRLAEAMDGRIGLESTEHVGTTFWVDFPRAA